MNKMDKRLKNHSSMEENLCKYGPQGQHKYIIQAISLSLEAADQLWQVESRTPLENKE